MLETKYLIIQLREGRKEKETLQEAECGGTTGDIYMTYIKRKRVSPMLRAERLLPAILKRCHLALVKETIGRVLKIYQHQNWKVYEKQLEEVKHHIEDKRMMSRK